MSYLEAPPALAVERDDVVVCIPVYGGHDFFVQCLSSVIAHTSADVPIVITDDASPDERSAEFVERLRPELGDRPVHYLRQARNVGFPANVNAVLQLAAPADVVIVNSDCVVAEGWLDGLRDAAAADSRIATVTALTNNGTIVSVPGGRETSSRLPDGWTLDAAAAAVRSKSLRLRPRLPTAIGHCVLIRRSAIELVGDFDEAFSPGYGEEVDFSQRCLRRGLSHVLADDVYVQHHGAASFGELRPVQAEHEAMLTTRYPYYHGLVEEIERDRLGPLSRALSAARRAISGLSVLIDGRILSGPFTGTQLQVLEVIAALERSAQVNLTVIVPDQPAPYAAQLLGRLRGVQLVTRSEVARREIRADLVHRPYQVHGDEDLTFLGPLAERLVVTTLDLISFHNPAYFRGHGDWHGYRSMTRAALAATDRVLFISGHARADALAEDLVEPSRASVVHLGVDHTLSLAVPPPTPPRDVGALPPDAPVILCLGTDFHHKNRLFALELLDVLRREHGFTGYLVFAGPHVLLGSSRPTEAELFALRPELAGAVIECAAVTDAEKAWLYERASLVVYPTVQEGFGLIPFEAADHGTPCMWAATTSLAEVLPADAGTIVPWSASATAERAATLLNDSGAARENLRSIKAAAQPLTWDNAARRLIEVYHETCDAPATPSGAIERGQGLMRGVLSEEAMRLVGPGGALGTEYERPLLALATHPTVGVPLLRLIRMIYQFGFRARRLRGSSGGS